MLPSDTHLKIKTSTVEYNNKTLVSDEKLSLGKNVEVNSLEPAKVIALEPSIKSFKAIAQPPPRPWGPDTWSAVQPLGRTLSAPTKAKKPTTHEDEKIALVLALAGGFAIWNIFQ